MPSNHVEFTREMREAGYTILVPNMLEFHFSLIVKVLRLNGYNAELLTNSGPNVMAEGLKYVHNDTCVSSANSSTRCTPANTTSTRSR